MNGVTHKIVMVMGCIIDFESQTLCLWEVWCKCISCIMVIACFMLKGLFSLFLSMFGALVFIPDLLS